RIKELKAGMQKDDFELVVVLADPYEFSEAKTEELYRNLKSAGFPSKVILSGKNTIAINRNLGICHSQGDFIIFLDDDVKLIGPVIEKLVKVLEDRPELGLVSVPSYDWRKMIHRPGSYHLKYRVNDELILTNRVSGMVMATRTELAKIAPFPTIWPNFAEDAQFSMQINRLGYLNAFVCPADTYAIHENRGDKLTANIHTLANVLINEGMSCYLEPLAASEELCRNLTITRMKQYGGTPASLSSIEKFWKDYRIGIENFLNGDSESLDELLQNACKNDWANARYKSIEEAAEYFRENKRQIVAFKNGMYKRLKFSDLNPFAGPFSYQKIDISKNISAIGRNMIKTAKIQKVLKKAVGNLKRVIKAINKNAEVVEIKIMPSSFPRGLMIDDSDFDNLVVYIRGIQQDQLQELNSLFLKWLQTPGLRLIDDYENPPLLIRVEDKANQELAYGINEMPMVTVYDKGRFSPRSKVAEEVNGLASMLFEKNVARIKIALSRGELDEKWVRSLLKNDNPESYYHQELMGILNNIEGFRLPPYVLNVVSTLDELYLKDKWTYVVPQGEEKVFEQALIELYEKGLVRFIDGKLMILWRMMGARWTDSVWNRRRFEIYSVDSHNNNAEINMLGPIEKKIVSQMSLIPEIELLESMASPNPYIAERAIRQSIGSRIASAEMIQAYLYNLGRKDILVNAAVIEAIKADKDCCEQELKEKLKEEISSKGQLSYFSPVRKRTLLIINILFNLALARPEKTDELVEFIFKTVISQKDIPDRIIQDVLKSLGTAYGNISNPELREMVYGFFSESAQSHIVRRKRIAQDMLKKADQIRSGYVLESEDSYGNMILEATSGEKISYKNYFTKGVFEPRNTILASAVKGREVTVIVDEAIYEEYHDKIRKYLETHHISGYSIYCGKASEHNKNIDSVFEIIDSAMKDGRNRKAIFVVVGGGTLMDVVGLVAQLYRRKVDYIRVPTTLLGIIDAGIGVKVGVNYKGHKNFVGAFYPPYAVVSDVSFLRTLDPRQMRSGMAEMLKMAIVSDRRLFEDIEKYGDKIIRNIPFEEKDEIIRRASMGELRHIQRDFYERDLRREVDFGHTFAHYIEDISEYSLLHGEAVALDVLITSHIAMQRGILKPAVFERIVKVVQGLGLPLFHESLTLENMVTGVQRAKEHKGGRLIAVIPEDIGKVVFTEEISKDEIEEALKYFRMKSGESSEPYGHPAFAFENMPEGIFTLKQYGEKTGVPLSTARRDFNVLEELGLVTIHKGSGNRPNEIESKFQEGIDKAEILNILSQYKDVRDIAKISYLIQETLNKGMRFFDVKQDKTNFPLFVYLGGGGPGATRITKEGSLQSAEGEKGSLGIGSIVTTFDYGGHSRKIQDFVREKEGKYIPSPGDTAALLSWLTPETWQPGPNSKESLQNVIDKEAKLNFLFKERITGENVIDTFRDRFATIDRDVDIKKSADWENFKEEMYGIARILDEYLAEMKIKNASVQNLMLLGCMVKMNFNISLALPEAQRILGIKGAKIIPVSSQESQLVGRFRNGREVFSEDAIAERDHGERFELFAFRKEKSNKNDAEQEAEDWPVARSEALDAIQKAKSAILTGASSIFTSVLPNFLVKDIALAVSERVNEGLPSILFANTAYEFESLHLTPVQIFETFERSIENVPGNNGIKLEDLYTHVVLPRIPESVKQEFLAGAREAIFKYLNQEGNRKLQAVAYDINDLDSIRMALEKMRKIFMNKNYQTDETIKGISDGKIKPGKIVPFHFYDYSQEVEEYLRRKGINVIWLDGPEDYFIWEGNVVHNTNSVIKVTKRICHETSTIEATSGALMLDLDNTFLRTEEGLEESLDERPTLKKLVSEILRRGVKVGFFSGVQYEQTENEPGIERRIIDHIPLKLRRGITVYSNSGAEEITFNVEGASSSNSEYNERTKISPHERKVLEGILEEAKNRYLRRVGRDRRRYHDIYGAEFFDKEPYSQFKGGKSDGSVYQIELVWIPSRKAIKNAEPGSEAETILHYGQKDEREVVVSFIQARIDQEKQKGALPTNTDYFVISGGFATIDISKTNKAAAVKHYVRSNSLNMDEVIYFGDSFGIGGNDRPVKSINNLLAVNVGEEIDIPGLVNLGEGVISTEKCLAQIAEILESLAKKKNFKSAVGIFKKQITENSYDAEHAAVLLFDLLHSSLQENRTYEIKYDISRLSSSQIELVETYIDRLRKMSGHSCTINSVGFSSKRTKKKRPLIEVSCMGENFAGKGRVDIKGNTEGYLLRLVGMMNMAFATSNIPSNATDEEMNTKYGPILGFIQRQYKDIFGAELVLPKSAEDILKVIQYISRTLPRAYKMPTDKIDEYNRLAIKALISA
ncbi:MAG: iron-containing alcohol dehydrogenase, partial [Candidatus Omnitrophica bacterium]|nr:iron-containing alcohol dehydrogenase [Candidatus Omnitrophota bacterium]